MISKEIIEQYRNKEVNNWDWVKEIPKKALMSEIQDLCLDIYGTNPVFKTSPFQHQLASFLLGIYNKHFLYFLDMGTGKTKVVLDLLSFYKKVNKISILVLVPNAASIDNWREQVETHSDLSCVMLTGKIDERLKELDKNEADIFITNYTGFQLMLTETVNGKWVGDRELVRYFSNKFNGIVLDECHSYGLKTASSLTFKLVKAISKDYVYRYGLTGTPMGRDPVDLWAQYFLIDRGETLGEHLNIFREAYFTQKNGYFGGIEYKFLKRYERALNSRIKNYSIRYLESEANELPEKVMIPVYLTFPVENWEYYKKALEGVILSKSGDTLEIQSSYHKLRQIASGFVDMKKDGSFEFKENPKLDKLREIIEGMPSDSKLIIFNEYIKSGDILSNFLKKLKIKHVRLYSGTADKIGAKNEFLTNPDCRILVANSQSANVSLNLQVANYIVFFESPVSPIIRSQAEKRSHRTGQKKTVFIYDLIVKNSIEEKISKYLKEGKDLLESLLNKKEIF